MNIIQNDKDTKEQLTQFYQQINCKELKIKPIASKGL